MTDEDSPKTPGSAITGIGVLITVIAITGTAIVLSDMSNNGFGDVEYGAVEKWLAAFAGLTVAALGVMTAAAGQILARLSKP